jgi:hypothetical protein
MAGDPRPSPPILRTDAASPPWRPDDDRSAPA